MRKQLLLGAGHRPYRKHMGRDGDIDWGDLTSLDINPDAKPTVVHDLNDTALPFRSEEFDEIYAFQVLEHTGRQGDYEFFFRQWNEFWRILKPNGLFFGIVPAYNHSWAWGDPGHTRVLTEGSFVFLDKMQYALQKGITAMSDYERLLGGRYWQPLSLKTGDAELRFILRKDTDDTPEISEMPSSAVMAKAREIMADPEKVEAFMAEIRRLVVAGG